EIIVWKFLTISQVDWEEPWYFLPGLAHMWPQGYKYEENGWVLLARLLLGPSWSRFTQVQPTHLAGSKLVWQYRLEPRPWFHAGLGCSSKTNLFLTRKNT